jgi:hypothetical protein
MEAGFVQKLSVFPQPLISQPASTAIFERNLLNPSCKQQPSGNRVATAPKMVKTLPSFSNGGQTSTTKKSLGDSE